jgi:hypothetical protein
MSVSGISNKNCYRRVFMIKRCFAVGLLACLLTLSAQAQKSLESLVSEAGTEWMFWPMAGPDGQRGHRFAQFLMGLG